MLNTSVRIAVSRIGAVALLAACSSSDTGITGTDDNSTTLSVDATVSTAYVSLGSPASVTTITSPTTSTAWDLAFTATPTVTVNGGASGPGGVKAYCLCANRNLSLTQVEALSATSGIAAFDAVGAASIPADSLFQSDASSQAISGWYDYEATTHAITANSTVWGIRLASTVGAYAKFHVISIPTPGQANAGPVTIEWAVQSTSTSALGGSRQLTVDLTGGAKVYVNLTSGTTATSSSASWDIALQGYTISVNGGSSGSGNVGAVPLVPSTFYASYAAITSIPVGAAGIPSSAFTTDGAGGAFLSAAPYRYDATSHQVYPSFDVYLVKRGGTVYKVQVASYYSTSGVFGVISLRYAKLAG